MKQVLITVIGIAVLAVLFVAMQPESPAPLAEPVGGTKPSVAGDADALCADADQMLDDVGEGVHHDLAARVEGRDDGRHEAPERVLRQHGHERCPEAEPARSVAMEMRKRLPVCASTMNRVD